MEAIENDWRKLMKIETLVKEIPPHINGGQSVHIVIDFYKDDDELSEEYKIEMESYGNSCVLNLSRNSLSPKFLRELADEIEKTRKEIQ